MMRSGSIAPTRLSTASILAEFSVIMLYTAPA
jgi:hypothetical protein